MMPLNNWFEKFDHPNLPAERELLEMTDWPTPLFQNPNLFDVRPTSRTGDVSRQ
jgi:hypothetical protein